MSMLWKTLNERNFPKETKSGLFLTLLFFANAAIGGLIWLLLGRSVLPEGEWLFCFMGYPAVIIGFFGGILYLYNHEF